MQIIGAKVAVRDERKRHEIPGPANDNGSSDGQRKTVEALHRAMDNCPGRFSPRLIVPAVINRRYHCQTMHVLRQIERLWNSTVNGRTCNKLPFSFNIIESVFGLAAWRTKLVDVRNWSGPRR